MSASQPDATPRPRPRWWALLIVGLCAGLLSGMFGVGGGVLVVPALVMLGFDQRLAAGTSAVAILPTAIVGTITYSAAGNVDWIAGLLLAAGIIVGAQIGSWLLAKLPRVVLVWFFVVFLCGVGASLWLQVPTRDAVIDIQWVSGVLLVLVGVFTGILAGILGVGGGIAVVPVLIAGFGASDLVAKGTSLLMMVPGSISATIANSMRKNVDIRTGLTVGIAASAIAPVGVLVANLMSPTVATAFFSALLVVIIAQLVIRELRRKKS